MSDVDFCWRFTFFFSLIDAFPLLTISLPVLQALAYTHDQGVLHLDVKPSNVVMEDALTPVLIDFDMSARARAREAEAGEEGGGGGASLSSMSSTRGTARFMEAEYYQGAAPERRTDVCSLGLTLFDLVYGEGARGTVIIFIIIICLYVAPTAAS